MYRAVMCHIQRRNRWKLVALISALSLTLMSCTLPYLHSPSLQKATAAASNSLPAEADALKPFDDQQANLAAFSKQEDLNVAQYWTGVRDGHLARLIALDRATRLSHLSARIDLRLGELTGGVQYQDHLDPSAAIAEKADLEDFAESMRRNFRLVVSETPERDLTCKTIIVSVSEAQATAYLQSGEPSKLVLGQLASLCRRITAKDDAINQFAKAGGLLGELTMAGIAAQEKTNTDLSPIAAELQRQIDEADKFVKSGSSAAQLASFESDITALLKNAKPGAKFAGWSKASDAIDSVLRSQVCSAEDVDDATKAEAKCDEVTPTGTTGRVSATWAMAKALAQLSDANAEKRRAVQWLTAAKVIIAAEKANAKLELDEAKAVAAAHRVRLKYAQREARYLIKAKAAGTRALPDCHTVRRGVPDPHCQFAAYVDAWNEGRIPGQIIEYRPVQISRSYAVHRSRAVAQKQHALAAAAADTLKGYGAGGLQAELIARALFDAASIGARGGL